MNVFKHVMIHTTHSKPYFIIASFISNIGSGLMDEGEIKKKEILHYKELLESL